jgi:cyclophilin family peptidyl-prolyl cis-trans isomerase
VFGKVLSGMEVVSKIEAVGDFNVAEGTQKAKVLIADSGELPKDEL